MRHRSGFLATPAPLYFDDFAPDEGGRECIVLVHGGGHTGACYLVTPEGRPGWAHRFLQHGYRVVVPDWPGTGRSGYVDLDALSGDLVCQALGALLETLDGPVVLLVHSMSGPYGFRLVETHGAQIRALVAVAPGPPGNVQPLPTVVWQDEHEIEVERLGLRRRYPKRGARPPSESLILDKLLGRTTRFPRQALDAYRASLVPLPARLSLERQNLDGSQLRIANAEPFRGKPILVLTGTHDTDHTREVDGAIATWLADIGAAVEFQYLGDLGIEGNGHMLMLEDNSDQLADRIVAWLAATGATQRPA